jgi:hypothetical protein
VSLVWALVSEPQWRNSGGGYKGVCVSVHVANEAHRQLVIEYPCPKDQNGRPLPLPQRPSLTPKIVETSVREVLAAGWDPNSRGKTFLYYVPDGS